MTRYKFNRFTYKRQLVASHLRRGDFSDLAASLPAPSLRVIQPLGRLANRGDLPLLSVPPPHSLGCNFGQCRPSFRFPRSPA
jgi:hypothetical protein